MCNVAITRNFHFRSVCRYSPVTRTVYVNNLLVTMTTFSKVLFYLKNCYSLCHCLFVKVPIKRCFIFKFTIGALYHWFVEILW